MPQPSQADTLKPGDPFPIETVRLSERAKQQLITLKRNTGIDNWNVLCRWAFCLSIKESTKPPAEGQSNVSSVEMHWKTFAGHEEDAYRAILLGAHVSRLWYVYRDTSRHPIPVAFAPWDLPTCRA